MQIVYIDDNASSRILVRRVLEAHGHTVVEFDNGVAGLEWLKECPIAPDALLLDIDMPDFDGFMTVASLRQDGRLRDLPVVFVTADVTRPTMERVAELGIDVIVKPIDVSRFVSQVRQACARARAKGEAA